MADRRLHAALAAIALSGAIASRSAASGIDPSAVSLTLEPGIGGISNVRIGVSDAASRALKIDDHRLSFVVRKIGDAKTFEVATTSSQEVVLTGPNAGTSRYFDLSLSMPSLAPGAYEISVLPQPGFVTTSAGSPLPLADAQAGSRSLNIYVPAVQAPTVDVATRFLALTGGGGGVRAGQIWSVSSVKPEAYGGRTYSFEHLGNGPLPRL